MIEGESDRMEKNYSIIQNSIILSSTILYH
jgi:hypothetical protein